MALQGVDGKNQTSANSNIVSCMSNRQALITALAILILGAAAWCTHHFALGGFIAPLALAGSTIVALLISIAIAQCKKPTVTKPAAIPPAKTNEKPDGKPVSTTTPPPQPNLNAAPSAGTAAAATATATPPPVNLNPDPAPAVVSKPDAPAAAAAATATPPPVLTVNINPNPALAAAAAAAPATKSETPAAATPAPNVSAAAAAVVATNTGPVKTAEPTAAPKKGKESTLTTVQLAAHFQTAMNGKTTARVEMLKLVNIATLEPKLKIHLLYLITQETDKSRVRSTDQTKEERALDILKGLTPSMTKQELDSLLNDEGQTALVLFLKNGNEQAAEHLITSTQADLVRPDLYGLTPLMYSVDKRCYLATRAIREASRFDKTKLDATTQHEDPAHRQTALDVALMNLGEANASKMETDLVELDSLITAGAKLYQPTNVPVGPKKPTITVIIGGKQKGFDAIMEPLIKGAPAAATAAASTAPAKAVGATAPAKANAKK